MNRRTILSLPGLGILSVIAVSATAPFQAAFAKDGSGGGGEGGDKGGGDGGGKSDGAEGKPEEGQQGGDQNGSETEQPGMEAHGVHGRHRLQEGVGPRLSATGSAHDLTPAAFRAKVPHHGSACFPHSRR